MRCSAASMPTRQLMTTSREGADDVCDDVIEALADDDVIGEVGVDAAVDEAELEDGSPLECFLKTALMRPQRVWRA